ncbi:MAG: MerR family transcriptional regulator [Bacteroidales bacterium]
MNDKGKLYFIIGEVSKDLDLSIPTLRFWEKSFPQLKPFKNKRGVRFYTSEDIEILKQIKYLTKECGFTIEGARAKLNGNSNVDDNYQIVETLNEIKTFLLDIKQTL